MSTPENTPQNPEDDTTTSSEAPAYTPPPAYSAPPAYTPPAYTPAADAGAPAAAEQDAPPPTAPPAYAAPEAPSATQPGGYPAPAYGSYPQAPQGAYPGAPAYAAPPAYGYAPVKTNVLAIISMIASIVGILWIVPFFGSLAGAIMGHISLKQIARTGEKGRGMALAGVIVGWAGLALLIIIGLFIVFAVVASSRYN